MKLTDESWISYQQGKGNEDTIAQFFSDDESRLDLTKEQKKYLRFGMAWMRRKEKFL